MKISVLYLSFSGFFAAALSGVYLFTPQSERELLTASVLASVHYIAVALGLSGVFLRGIFLRKDLSDPGNLGRMLWADNAWGIAALLLIPSGLLRAFGSFEKGSDYYLNQPMFHLKLGFFALIFILELWPMITLIRWRLILTKNQTPDFKRQKVFEYISHAESIVILFIVFTAGFMARGISI